MILTIIGVVSGGALAIVFSYAEPLILENRKRAINKAVKAVVPGASQIKSEKSGDILIYRGIDGGGRVIGYAFRTEFSGFQGKIAIMIGMDARLEEVTGLEVLENIETPGLGNKIDEQSWRNGFAGLSGLSEMILVKNIAANKQQNEIEAITGATISSQAVVDGANAMIDEVRRAVVE